MNTKVPNFPHQIRLTLIVSINFLAPCLRFIMFCAYLQYHQNRCFVPWYVKESRFQRILHGTGCTASIECNGCTECTQCTECTYLPAESLTDLYVNVLDSFSLKNNWHTAHYRTFQIYCGSARWSTAAQMFNMRFLGLKREWRASIDFVPWEIRLNDVQVCPQ